MVRDGMVTTVSLCVLVHIPSPNAVIVFEKLGLGTDPLREVVCCQCHPGVCLELRHEGDLQFDL